MRPPTPTQESRWMRVLYCANDHLWLQLELDEVAWLASDSVDRAGRGARSAWSVLWRRQDGVRPSINDRRQETGAEALSVCKAKVARLL